jgi:glycosyltransferase involved in cell wall biosynthesis
MSIHLVLFFTRGVSLRMWQTVGMLEREVALYRLLVKKGIDVSFVTYGDASEQEFSGELGGIRILCNESGLPVERYQSMLFSLHGRELRHCSVIKTNQSFGGDLALWTSRFFRKPLIARCGYMWSFNAGREHGPDSPEATEARRVEEKLFCGADKVVVTTQAMKRNVIDRFPKALSRTTIIPNYVDTDLFQPATGTEAHNTLLFVGRIAPEKNLDALFEAVSRLSVRLVLIGEGKIRPKLESKFGELNGRVVWKGNVPNKEIPRYLHEADILVLPSFYEGHPKVILEAMACGVPVIGADSPGIRDLIENDETGLLCNPDPLGMQNALERLLNDAELRLRLGNNGRKYVEENFSLARIAEIEMDLLTELGERRDGPKSRRKRFHEAR